MDQGCPWLSASTENAEFTGTGPELALDEATGDTLTRLDVEDNHATRPNPRPSPSGSGGARIRSAQVTELAAVACASLALSDLDLRADSELSESEIRNITGFDSPASDVVTTNGLLKSPKVVRSSKWASGARGTVTHIRAAARRKARQKSVLDRDDLAVRQDEVHRLERWARSLVEGSHFLDFMDVFSSKRLARFPRYWDATKECLSQPWAREYLWLHPPDRLWEQTVQKLKFEQGQGIAIVPMCKDRDWWWSLSEVVVDWVDEPAGEPLFVNKKRTVCSSDREYRIVVIDAFGWTPKGATSDPVHTAELQQALWSTTPSRGDSVLVDPRDSTVSASSPHTPPEPSIYSLLHGADLTDSVQDGPDSQACRQMRRQIRRQAQKRSTKGVATQSESEASPGPDVLSSDEFGAEQKRQSVTAPPVINLLGRNRHMLGPAETTQHDWLRGYRKHIRSVIQSDEDWDGCDDLKKKFMERYEKLVFRPINTQDVAEAAKKSRGPHSTLKLELLPEHAGPRADKPIRAVGDREKALWDKIVNFKGRGMLRDAKGQPQRVARVFLFPKPGKNDWRLVINYRHLNSCLKGDSFPLPVIEDQK